MGDGKFFLNPTSIVTHEISHGLFGYNNFHTSGGNHRGSTETMPWMNIQGGYGLMGAAGAGLVSCNGYERWRMHWKHPSAPYYIYARDFANIGFADSDISKEDGNKWFTLRDFVTYGDAVRIKLPYKDSTITPNQYIWLEFHNVGNNDKLDFLQFTNDTNICLHPGTPGIYAYYQIGRDLLESTDRDSVWDMVNRDNIRVISNEGYWDYTRYLMPQDTNFVCTQWNWENCYYVPEYSNAICGYQDQEKFIVPKYYDEDLSNTIDSVYENGHFTGTKKVIREYVMMNKVVGNDTICNNISWIGDGMDAFSSRRKINMGTNPSTCNAKTCYTSNNYAQTKLTFDSNSQYNNTTTYLTGLSIEMIPVSTGDRWRVRIRWDDYDIVNDARWTGKIVLKGTEQVNLTRGHSITLAQNRTPAQRLRDTVSGYFAEVTKLTCEAGSVFTQQPQSTLILSEKSRFVLDSGATYHLGDSAQIVVQGRSTFTVSRGADFTGGISSEIIVDSLATLYVYDTARFCREARIIVHPGGKLVVNGGTLTSACDGEMWEGIVVEGNPDIRQAALAQGSVILTDATVENARMAIITHKVNDSIWVGGGGIVQATNTLFRNNRTSVEFTPYENHYPGTNEVIDNASFFTRCTFLVDEDNLFAENGTSFDSHAILEGVRGVGFEGCAFRNRRTGTGSGSGHAIRSIGAGFVARRVCPLAPSPQDPCYCTDTPTDTVTRCTFEGFFEAVHAANTLGSYDITLDNCDFSGNSTGVVLAAADNARVSFCNFDLSSLSSFCGLCLNNSTGYTIESNTLHSEAGTNFPIAIGIRAVHSGTAENVIRKNEFRNLMTGGLAQDTNATPFTVKPPSGLQFHCNDSQGCDYDIAVVNGRIRSQQGSASAGSDNSFHYATHSSFLLSNAESFTYWHSNTGYHAPYNPPATGVTLKNTAAANSCASSLCGETPFYPRGGDALSQYTALSEELSGLLADYESLCHGEGTAEEGGEEPLLLSQISDLSASLGDLSRAAVRAILSDSVVDDALLKEWYGTIVETHSRRSVQGQATPVPAAAYQLSEVYSDEGDWAAARGVLAFLPSQFAMDSADTDEYRNYLALQRLRENVEGNWYLQTETEVSELQGVAERNGGRAARMAKEILCFFHHICYEDEPLAFLEGIEERNARGDAIHQVSTTTGTGTLDLYPNPAHNTLTVESASPIREITVYDMTGHAVMVRANNDSPQRYDLNTAALHRGIYLLKVVSDHGTETAKFVKN